MGDGDVDLSALLDEDDDEKDADQSLGLKLATILAEEDEEGDGSEAYASLHSLTSSPIVRFLVVSRAAASLSACCMIMLVCNRASAHVRSDPLLRGESGFKPHEGLLQQILDEEDEDLADELAVVRTPL
jgi:hypothetical protein